MKSRVVSFLVAVTSALLASATFASESGIVHSDNLRRDYASLAEALADAELADGHVLQVSGNDAQGGDCTITNAVTILLEGHTVGTRENPATLRVGAGGDLTLTCGAGGLVGSVVVGTDASASVSGGSIMNYADAAAVSASGSNSVFNATGTTLAKGEGENSVVEAYGDDATSAVTLSNVTITGVSVSGTAAQAPLSLADTGIDLVGGGRLLLSGTTVKAGDYGVVVMDLNSTCVIDRGSAIEARYGIKATPSVICVSNSAVKAVYTAFWLMSNNVAVAESGLLSLGGTNAVEAGTASNPNAHAVIDVMDAPGNWRVSIGGGTYSHQVRSNFDETWVDTNACDMTWLTDTKFEVTPRIAPPHPVIDENYAITYEENVPSNCTLTVTNSNPRTYTASSTFDLGVLECRNAQSQQWSECEWTLGGDTNRIVRAIERGQVMVLDQVGLTNVASGVACQDVTLAAVWGPFQQEEPETGTITFATGAWDEDFEVDWEDPEDGDLAWPTANEAVRDGYEYCVTNVTVALPTATDVAWAGHTFSHWEAYWENDDGVVTNRSSYTTSITVTELAALVDKGWDETFHATWKAGSQTGGLAGFDQLYNDEDKPLTGGDTYVGTIMDGDKVIGTATVRCGLPRSDGTVSVSATVKIIGEGTRTYAGTGSYNGDTIDVDIDKGEDTLSFTLGAKSFRGSYNGYDIRGGANKFKGSQEDKDEADSVLAPWLGKWVLIFATQEAETFYDTDDLDDDSDVDGQAHAWGYSHVVMDIKDKGKVVLSGKLASGKEVSATATAIVGDNGVCVPAVCSIYSGYDWRRFGSSKLADYAKLEEAGSSLSKFYMKNTSRGGFGFTAWFSMSNNTEIVNVNNISDWDSTRSKSQPFLAQVAYTNHQRVASIQLPPSMEFCVDGTKDGWIADTEHLGDVNAGSDWIPAVASNSFGYVQFVDVSVASANGASNYTMKARGKAPKMKLVDEQYIVPNKGGANYAKLKLKYVAEKGVFKGSFRLCTIKDDEETGDAKLKKTKVKVSGGIAEGRGYGTAHTSKAGSQPVMLVAPSDADMLLVPESDDESDDESEDEEPEVDAE